VLREETLNEEGAISAGPVQIPPSSGAKRAEILRLEESQIVVAARVVILREPELWGEEDHEEAEREDVMPLEQPFD